MDREKQEHCYEPNVSIRVPVSPELMARLKKGPLAATGGKGGVPFVRKLILDALDQWDAVHAGKTQYDPAYIPGNGSGQARELAQAMGRGA